MAKRSTRTTLERHDPTGAARTKTERPSIVYSSLYLPEPVYEALRRIAFEERPKIHDVVLEGIDAVLRRHPIATRRPTMARGRVCASGKHASLFLFAVIGVVCSESAAGGRAEVPLSF